MGLSCPVVFGPWQSVPAAEYSVGSRCNTALGITESREVLFCDLTPLTISLILPRDKRRELCRCSLQARRAPYAAELLWGRLSAG